jgi:hypothetical protein
LSQLSGEFIALRYLDMIFAHTTRRSKSRARGAVDKEFARALDM